MFQVGEDVFYENTGVCRIAEISPQHIPGSKESRLYYTLHPRYQQCVIRTPVDGNKVLMRAVISRKDAEDLIDMIPNMQAEAYHGKANGDLVEHYRAALRSFDCEGLIKLTMSIYAKRQEAVWKKGKLGTVDERYMRRAEDLLFGELAVALGIPKEDVPGYISDRVDRVRKAAGEQPEEQGA